ncbi:F-box protein At3g07870-like [Telopea speciosissima]|uniref:F-box protein At3g07870-like n=1 Tax=Telopea speciosissima TaxID=54955 RepID=UPI001CC7C6AC|nr:F-box protein At3g07870-like [Telopea speciosissima]XP_043718178.1 F-box protein At3g07870-like [Telopea speciosissima]
MRDLPYEIFTNIFSRLSIKSLFQFRCVCKTWRDLLTDPHFIKQQLNRSSETNISNPNLILNCGSNLCHVLYSIHNGTWDDKPVKLDLPFKLSNIGIVGSCNGLVCLLGFSRVYDVIVWNPFTRDFNKLPYAPLKFPGRTVSRFPVMGFGYSPSKDVYKVIRVIYFHVDRTWSSSCSSLVQVHTLGSDSWRRIGEIPFEIRDWLSGVFVNGALHWIAIRSSRPDTIVSFDVGNEKFRKMPQPYFGDDGFQSKLEVLGGFLCMICTYYDNRVKIWVMKDYGVKESWIKQFSISQPMVIGNFKCLKPLGFTKSGEILLEMHDRKLVLYDPERKIFRNFTIRGVPDWSEAGAFIGTLISPEACS